MDKIYRALGFMSGTSMDGIDVALIETNGEAYLKRHGGRFKPYDPEIRSVLVSAMHQIGEADHRQWPYYRNATMPDDLSELLQKLVAAHSELAIELLAEKKLMPEDIDLIGYHGQTLIHRPDIGFTYQLADGAALASQLGVQVVSDLRLNDMKHGGQGAPLAPIYHKALVKMLIDQGKISDGPYVVVNIGGVSNITYIDQVENLMAFDTGPGNALLDDWVSLKTGEKYDQNGTYSLAGQTDRAWVKQRLNHSYFTAHPPKSLDRDEFTHAIASLQEAGVSLEDGAASLVALTVDSIALSVQHFKETPRVWIIAGGGQHNIAILRSLERAVSGQIIPINDLGIDGDLIEAECFAYLAVRSFRYLPISFPETTGVPVPMTGGVSYSP